jgi:hypothetical protein
MKARLPTAMPLPEVLNYSEVIGLSSLEFPLDFEQESLLLNLRAIARVSRVAGLVHTSVDGVLGANSLQGIDEIITAEDIPVAGRAEAEDDNEPEPPATVTIKHSPPIYSLLGSADPRPETAVHVNLTERRRFVNLHYHLEGP